MTNVTTNQAQEEAHVPQTAHAYYRPSPLPGLTPALILFFLVYWLILGFQLQRIDFSQSPEWWQTVIAALPLLDIVPVQLVNLVTQAFSPLVWRHVAIPTVIGWWLANQAAISFVQHFYQFANQSEAARFLGSLQASSRRQAGSTISEPSGRTRMGPTTVYALITFIPATIIFLLFLYSRLTPPSPESVTVYSTLLVLLGSAWILAMVAYSMHRFVGSIPAASGLRLERESLAINRRENALLRVGGPGTVIVGGSDAIITEYNGRYSRSLGAGARRLRPYEYVRAIIDLRQQERSGEVSGITQDGVEIRADIALTFRIRNNDSEIPEHLLHRSEAPSPTYPTRTKLYPFGENALRLAAYSETVNGPDEVLGWDSLPLIIATEEFQKALGQSNLKTLFDLEAEHTLAHPSIINRVTEHTKIRLHEHGITLISLRLGALQAPEDVMTQNLNGWRTYWQNVQKQRGTRTLSDGVLTVKDAKQEAEAAVLRALLKGIQEGRRTGSVRLQEGVALHLIKALESIVEEIPEGEERAVLLQQLRILYEQLKLPE